MNTKSITDIVGVIVSELTPLSSEERMRVVRASLTLLGEAEEGLSAGISDEKAAHVESADTFPLKVQNWMKQNSISVNQIEEVFHVSEDQTDVIAPDVPGNNKREKTLNAYVICGLASFISSGDTAFDDKSARSLCDSLGCYDATNHSTYIKNKGNEFTGSKEKGWSLTGPGLKHAAQLIGEMTK